ncbi:pentatricopeptide repeat-containing protein [Striga asiatica]|uniref:Pentatricopeptide repeat-containing protein n=1 Tax=Striga asiatica TaxID=4170 RepID=A0A5A7P4S5_STRAF|nr:pentatricopeptide repeat-containing protein [Striga asiatica]
MGNWNRRYLPRRKFRQDEFEDPSLSPPRPLGNNYSHSSGSKDNRVPSWEIEYCKSAKVPWNKILASKRYIVCYPNVQYWDASSGEEALQNAKRRYWAMINGIPCDTPLPDPDTYIDKIDWDPHLDPELMADLDRQYCDPDKLETINEEVEPQHDRTQSTVDNPWERDQVQGTGSSKDAVQGWSRWDDSVNSRNKNPWEQNCSQPVDSLKESVWKSGDESWGRQKSAEKSSTFGNYGQSGNDSLGWGRWNSNGFSGYNNNKDEFYTGSTGREWRDNVKESGYFGNSQSYRAGGCKKREGFQQHGSKYKSSRYHGDTWR